MLAAKVGVDRHIPIQAQELPHHFHGHHLGISQGRRWPTAAHPLPARMVPQLGQQLIDQAIDGYSEVLQVHGAPP